MKRKTAKEILADSFRELANIKDADKITVKDIAANCGYSPATFYRQFKDKYDLIGWDYSRKLAEIMDKLGTDNYSWRDSLLDGANYFNEEKEYLKNLFLHTTGMDSFLENMTELNDDMLRKCITQAKGEDSLDEELQMCIHMYCHGTVALTCDWVLGKYKADANMLARVFEETLPEPLKPYLVECI